MKLRVLIAGAAMCITVSACGAQATSAEQSPPVTTVTQTTVPYTPPPPPPTPLETLHQVEGDVNSWLTNGLHVNPPAWHDATAGEWECNRTVKERNAFYCETAWDIYIPMGAVENWSLDQRLGDAYQTAHEATHHLQKLANGMPNASPAGERQANCGSGVFVRWAMDNGTLNFTPYAVADLIATIGSVPDDPTHISADMAAAFDTGYKAGSLAACVPIAGPLAGA